MKNSEAENMAMLCYEFDSYSTIPAPGTLEYCVENLGNLESENARANSSNFALLLRIHFQGFQCFKIFACSLYDTDGSKQRRGCLPEWRRTPCDQSGEACIIFFTLLTETGALIRVRKHECPFLKGS